MTSRVFYPVPWRWLAFIVSAYFVVQAPLTAWTADHWIDWIRAVADVALGAFLFVRAVRAGVVVSGDGVDVRRFVSRWWSSSGRLPWDELASVEVFRHESVNTDKPQLGLRTVDGERVRLGRLAGREELLRDLQQRLPTA